jgi:molybdopterin converting factor small subunit
LSARTLGELIAQLRARTDVGAVAESCTFLVDGGAGDPDQPLTDSSVVDVLPPFAGG